MEETKERTPQASESHRCFGGKKVHFHQNPTANEKQLLKGCVFGRENSGSLHVQEASIPQW
jgi:hypothetical protein